MIKNLIKLADSLEASGNKVLADRIDNILVSIAQEIEGKINAKDLVKIQPGETRKHHMLRTLLDLIDFDLMIDKDGEEARIRAIPKIQEGKTDALNLGTMMSMPGIEKFLKVEKQGPVFEGEDAPKPRDIDDALEGIMSPEERGREERDQEALRQQEVARQQQEALRQQVKQVVPEATKEVEMGDWQPEEERDVPMLGRNEFYVDNPKNRKKYPEMWQTGGTIMERLVKMADRFDQEGNFKMAAKIDGVLKQMASGEMTIDADGKVGMADTNPDQPLTIVEAARPKAPLKGLKDDVKKNLVLFIVDADKSLSKGVGGLKELFRRLRYFDIADTVKDLGLDKVVKEMERTQSCLDAAKKDFYTITFGKRPSESDLKGLLESLSGGSDEDDAADGQAVLDFFDANAESNIETAVQEHIEESDNPEFSNMTDAIKSTVDEGGSEDEEELLRNFWAELDNEKV